MPDKSCLNCKWLGFQIRETKLSKCEAKPFRVVRREKPETNCDDWQAKE